MDKNIDFDPTKISLPRYLPKHLAYPIEWLLSLDKLSKVYNYAKDCGGDVKIFLDRIITKTASRQLQLHDVPKTGALVVVCNHPLGGLEGIMLARSLLEHRSDVKVLTNSLLCRIKQFENLFIGVDVIGKTDTKKNVNGLKQLFEHIKSGGAVLIFPSGTVSRFNIKNFAIEEPAWKNFVGKLILKYEANCLPLHFVGRNSFLFYLLSLIHPMLGTLRLPKELSNKTKSKISVKQGKLITAVESLTFTSSKHLTKFLELKSSMLGKVNTIKNDEQPAKLNTKIQALQLPPTSNELITKVASLNKYKVLVRKNLEVYCAPAKELEIVLEFTGICRALSFPGLDKSVTTDLDKYDEYYHQLFMWDTSNNCIVGGYRVGHVADIIKQYGVKGLYCHSLFKFKKDHLPDYKHSIEVGRSYIHPYYQRNLLALDTIWKAIGSYTMKTDNIHTLYGSVSLGIKESEILGSFIARMIMANNKLELEKSNKIKPRKPIKKKYAWNEDIIEAFNSIPAINKLVGSFNNKVAVATLVKHYLNLNGKIVNFTVNKYMKCLDGLIFVDLRTTDPKRLKRYIGEQSLQKFEQRWGLRMQDE